MVKKLRDLQRAKDDQTLATCPKTVAQFLEEWLRLAVVQQRKPRVYEDYEGIVRNHLVPAIGAVRLVSLTKQQVQKLLNGLAETHAYNTIRNVRAVLRKACNQEMD